MALFYPHYSYLGSANSRSCRTHTRNSGPGWPWHMFVCTSTSSSSSSPSVLNMSPLNRDTLLILNGMIKPTFQQGTYTPFLEPSRGVNISTTKATNRKPQRLNMGIGPNPESFGWFLFRKILEAFPKHVHSSSFYSGVLFYFPNVLVMSKPHS